MSAERAQAQWVMPASDLQRLVSHLVDHFDEVWGPVVADGVIRLRTITSAAELPTGITDQQETASYRLIETGTARRFSYGLGPDSLKALVHPTRSPVWRMHRRDGTLIVDPALHPTVRRAVIGARACDLRALAVLARTQIGGDHVDPAFAAHHAGLFLVAVDCTDPAPTCFCGSTGNGPAAEDGFDLALTELADEHGVAYLVRAGSDAGRAAITALQLEPAPDALVHRAATALAASRQHLMRELPVDAAERVGRLEHPHWADVAERCLTCGNCTAVCPTCFCTDMEDRVSLDGRTSIRTRVWDSCFSLAYSQLGPSPNRASPASRYRQWLSHKLGTWHDQFGESGCVGCGRCITWCPVGIDLTAEVDALGATPVEVAP